MKTLRRFPSVTAAVCLMVMTVWDAKAQCDDWVLTTTFTNPTPQGDAAFGAAVAAIGEDKVVIGAVFDDAGADRAGAAYVFGVDGVLRTVLTNPTPDDNDLFGIAVAGVGTDRVLVGALRDDTGATDAGAAYLFATDGALLTTFTNPTPEQGALFGQGLPEIDEGRLLSGS